MKNVTKSLLPLAALALLGASMVSVFGLLVVALTSFGFADGLPLFYFYRLNFPVISVALSVAGMILFATILLGLAGKPAKAIKPAVIDGAIILSISDEGNGEKHLAKAA